MYEHIIAAAVRTPWAIDPESREWAALQRVLSLRASGHRLTDEAIQAEVERARASQGPRRGARTIGAVGVIPIYGAIIPRASLMTEMSGGTSVSALRESFRAALDDPAISSILFEFDSPGGQVDGIEEFATEIRAARGRKPMAAISFTMMGSAAYYLGSQADEVIASPSSLTGSIGVYTVHVDESRADELAGVDVTVIKAGKYKAEAAYGPLTPEAREAAEQRIGDYYNQFANAVAKGRGVTAAAVRSGYGEGRSLTAQRALEAGLVDRVDTFDNTIRRLASGKGPISRGTTALEALIAGEGDVVLEATGEGVELGETLVQPVAGEQLPTTHEDGPPAPPAVVTEADPDPAAELELAVARARMHRR